jgi:CRP-like cAMP-binding protein
VLSFAVVDAFFLLDVLLTFRTAYFDDDGDHLVIVPTRIARQYIATWFVPDLLGSLPIDSIVRSFYHSQANFAFAKLLKVVRLVRLFKITRLLKIGYVTEFMEDYLGLSPAAINLFTMLAQVFFVGHLVACVLWGLSGVIVRTPWWGHEVETVHPPMAGSSLFSQYILSLYWTFTIMSTVGYGDIYPTTTPERLLNIFVILLGASMFGYMIANVSSLIQSLNSSDAVMNDKIASITEYLDEKQCPHKLQDAVIKHFRNFYKHASPFDVDTMLTRLPQRLANEVLLIHHANTLKNIAVLKYVENVTIRLYIFSLMKPVYYEPNEDIIQQGTVGTEIFFLTEGRAVAFKKKEEVRQPRGPSPLQLSKSFRRLAAELVRVPSRRRQESFQRTRSDSAKAVSPGAQSDKSSKLEGSSGHASPHWPLQRKLRSESASNKSTRFGVSSRLTSPVRQREVEMPRIESALFEGGSSKVSSPSKPLDHSQRADELEFPSRSATRSRSPSPELTWESEELPPLVTVDHVPTNRQPGMVAEFFTTASGAAATAMDALHHPLSALATAAEQTHTSSKLFLDAIRAVDADLQDIEPVMQSPPPPLPSRMQRFQFSIDVRPDMCYPSDDSDQEFEAEYEALRNQATPYNNASREKTFADDAPAPAQHTLTFASKGRGAKTPGGEGFEDSDSDDDDSNAALGVDGLSHKFDPAFLWREQELRKRGLELVGELSPGDFMGHLSLMHEAVNMVTVVTAAYSTVFTLNKQDITPLLTKQPTVSMHLQMALSRAISAQADVLGKFHMRQARSKFLVHSKERYYQRLGVTPGEVKRIRRTVKNRVGRAARNLKGKVALRNKDARKESFYLSTGASATLNADFSTSESARLSDDHDESHIVSIQAFTRLGRERSASLAAQVGSKKARVLSRRQARKVKSLERVLTKYSVLYDSTDELSDEEDAVSGRKQKIRAHRTPLPPTVALRSVALLPATRPKRRTSFLVPSPASHASMSGALLRRLLTHKQTEKAKDTKQLRRVASFNDFETLDHLTEPVALTTELHFASSSAAQPSEEIADVVPIYSNRAALRHETELRGRRQSFPSLDNDLWRVKTSSQGLL